MGFSQNDELEKDRASQIPGAARREKNSNQSGEIRYVEKSVGNRVEAEKMSRVLRSVLLTVSFSVAQPFSPFTPNQVFIK